MGGVMEFSPPLIAGTLIRRYKRFLADVRLEDGREVVAHTANTGAMTGCAEPGMRIWLSENHNPKRKTRFSWELSATAAGVLIGVHTHLANRLVAEAVSDNCFAHWRDWQVLGREVPLGARNRADLLLGDGKRRCLVEVKSVTLAQGDTACFPDARSERGLRQLRVMTELARQGTASAVVYCVQRGDVEAVRPADEIDPDYGAALREAVAAGVGCYGLRIAVSAERLQPETTLSVRL